MITYIDVNNLEGNFHPLPGGDAIVCCGDAPVWKVCALVAQLISEGVVVIYVGPGEAISTSRGDYIAAYSMDPKYPVGSKCRCTLGPPEQRYLPGYFDGSWD